MKKILSTLFATSYFLAQIFLFVPPSFALGEFHSNIGDKFEIISVEKNNVLKNSAVGTNPLGDNTVNMQPYKITWQITPAMRSEIESGQLINFQLFRKYDNYPEQVVVAGIHPYYYYTIDPGVNSSSPQYKVEAFLANGQKYQTEYYQYGSGEVVESTPNIVNTPTNDGTMVHTEVDPIDGAPGGNTGMYIDPANTPLMDEQGNGNYSSIKEAVESSGSSFDWQGIVTGILSNLGSGGGFGTDYTYNQEIPNYQEFEDLFNQIAVGGLTESLPSSTTGVGDLVGVLYDSCSSSGKCTAGKALTDIAKKTPIDTNILDTKTKTAIEDFKKTNPGKRAIENLKTLETQVKDEDYQPGAPIPSDAPSANSQSPNSDAGPTGEISDNATESANYYKDFFEAINIVDVKCEKSGNTGILCLIETIIFYAMSLASLIAITFVVYGGYLYITSAGNQEGSQAGIKAVTNAAIGLVIILASWIIINTILTVISGS